MVKLRIAFWLWKKLGKWIQDHVKERVDKTSEPVVAYQLPNYLYMDGTWMPDKRRNTIQ